jgi:hypothetical protein
VDVAGSRSVAHGMVVRSDCNTQSCDWIVATSRARRTAWGAAAVVRPPGVEAEAAVEAEVEAKVEVVSTFLYCRAPWDRNAALKASSASPPRHVDREAAAVDACTLLVGSEDSRAAKYRAISFWNALGRAQRLVALVGAMPEEAAAVAAGLAEGTPVLLAEAEVEPDFAVALAVSFWAAVELDVALAEEAWAEAEEVEEPGCVVVTDLPLAIRLLSLRMRRACAKMASMASTGLSCACGGNASAAASPDRASLVCTSPLPAPEGPESATASSLGLRFSGGPVGCLSCSSLHDVARCTAQQETPQTPSMEWAKAHAVVMGGSTIACTASIAHTLAAERVAVERGIPLTEKALRAVQVLAHVV